MCPACQEQQHQAQRNNSRGWDVPGYPVSHPWPAGPGGRRGCTWISRAESIAAPPSLCSLDISSVPAGLNQAGPDVNRFVISCGNRKRAAWHMALHSIQRVTVIISINFCSAPGSKSPSSSLERPGFLKILVFSEPAWHSYCEKNPFVYTALAWVGTGPPPLRFYFRFCNAPASQSCAERRRVGGMAEKKNLKK